MVMGLCLIEHRWRSEVAGQHKDYLMAILWRTNHLTLRQFHRLAIKKKPRPANAAGGRVTGTDARVHFPMVNRAHLRDNPRRKSGQTTRPCARAGRPVPAGFLRGARRTRLVASV